MNTLDLSEKTFTFVPGDNFSSVYSKQQENTCKDVEKYIEENTPTAIKDVLESLWELDKTVNIMLEKDVIFCDLDQTLAPSKGKISPQMAEYLSYILQYQKIVIITGGIKETVDKNVIAQLPSETNFSNLYIAPIQGNEIFAYNPDIQWYSDDSPLYFSQLEKATISPEEVEQIETALEQALDEFQITDYTDYPLANGLKTSDIVQKRGEKDVKWISVSLLWQEVPQEYYEYKKNFDIDQKKRQKFIMILKKHLSPEVTELFDFKIWGSSTIDIVRKGFDKWSGTQHFFSFHNNLQTDVKKPLGVENALMFWDSFGKANKQENKWEGNDAAVLRTWIPCLDTQGDHESTENLFRIYIWSKETRNID